MTKICIYGAGAIGGLVGAELALAESDVTLIARGPHLEAMQANGLALIKEGETRVAKPFATDDPAKAGPQDYIFITLKAHSVPGIVEAIQPLMGPETAVVWGVNGVPWWYFYQLEGDYRDKRLESIDPGNGQWDKIGPERIIGCVVYPAAEVVEPGVIQHVEGNRFSLGEPSGEKTERVQLFAKELSNSGFRVPIRPRIRDELWVKLWGNLSFNPMSVLTGKTLEDMGNDPELRSTIRTMMLEAQTVGEKIGVKFLVDVDKRLDGATAVGAHKTSMLQDYERGRPMEIDALVGAVAEMGRLTNTPTPTIDRVLAEVIEKAREAGCYE
ncbi:MAG: 2-dehydropantoate 2-reductase [Rhodospirillaceae bacterium]|jgi:2-dehydropantoate 2-reductase|nr:2-dehydropantoate 2-reductase [Rhodospirillaceae bacterium]MBT7956336.1 2-dehydropantoate 2-reductase [Rhodospirillaceae bacterium]